jgi:hypothetical protein
VPDDRQVVRDQHEREVVLALQVAQQVEDLCLDRDVERRDGLVGDDQLRLQRERARDADALTLAAGELVRVAVVVLGVEPHLLHQFLDRALALAVPLLQAVDHERLADDRSDRLARVQRRVRILEDHLHLAAQRLQLSPRQVCDLLARDLDAAARRLEEPVDQARRRRLATACLADDAERLAALDVERDAVHGAHSADLLLEDDPPGDREVLDEVADLHEVVAVGRGRQLDRLLLGAQPAAPVSTVRPRLTSSGDLPSFSCAQIARRVSAERKHRTEWSPLAAAGSSSGWLSRA